MRGQAILQLEATVQQLNNLARGKKGVSIGIGELVITHIGPAKSLGPFTVKAGKLYENGQVVVREGLEILVENVSKF